MDSNAEEKQKDSCMMKPCATSMGSGSVAELPPRTRRQSFSVSSTELEVLSKKICESGFRFAHGDFKSWAAKMEALHKPIWEKAGIFEAIKASTYVICKNPSMILALVEKWSPKTKSFIFPWGEATVTLEDVMVLLGFPVLGASVFGPLESSEMRDSVEEMEKLMKERMRKFCRVSQVQWISSFTKRDDMMLEHDAFLALWLSNFVFPEISRSCVSRHVLPIAVRLARGEKIALAPAVLASLYRDLGQIHAFAMDKRSTQDLNLTSLFKLVQVWAWERFRDVRPEATPLQKDEPRIARWRSLSPRYERLSFDGFEWRPYAKPLENWNSPRFYLDEAKWMTVDDSLDDEFVSFARCLRVSQLVGIGFVEDYYPHRVAMQFGFSQDLPGLVTDYSNFTEKEAWDDYNKPLDCLKLYIPSSLATTSVTSRDGDWWLKSDFMSYEGSSETFNASNTVNDDDVNASLKDLPLSQVFQKLGDELPKLKRSVIKKGKRGDCGGSASREVPLSEMFQKELVNRKRRHLRNKQARVDDDKGCMDCDDIISIAGGDAFESLKENYNDSGVLQKLASEDKTVEEREQRSEENDDDEETGGKAEKTGNEPECLLPKDGAIVGEKASSGEKEDAAADDNSLIQKICAIDNDGDDGSLTIGQKMRLEGNKYSDVKNSGGDSFERSRLEAEINDSSLRQKLDSIRADGDETIQPPQKEQRTGESGSKSGKNMVMSPFDENNSSDPPLGFDEAISIVVSPPEKRQTCEDEIDVFGSNAGNMTIIEDGSKEAKCLLPENGAIIVGEKASSSEKEDDSVCDDKLIDDGTKEPECLLSGYGAIIVEKASSGEKEDDEKLIECGSKEPECMLLESSAKVGGDSSEPLVERSRVVADINDSSPCQKPDSIRADGDETIQPPQKEQRTDDAGSKSGKNMVLSLFDENNSSGAPPGFDEAINIVVSPPEKRQTCENELDVFGSNADKMTIIDHGSKEPESLLPEDNAIVAGEKASSSEKEDDSVYDEKLIDDGNKEPECLHSEDGAIVVEKVSLGEKKDDDGSKETECLFSEDGAVVVVKASSGEKEIADEKMIDDGTKEPECLLSKDGAIFVEKASSGEKDVDDGTQELECLLPEFGAIDGEKAHSGEKKDDAADYNSLIQQNLAIEEPALMAHNNELTPHQNLANGYETRKAYGESDIHIAVEGESQGHDSLHHDNALGVGSEETNEQLEDLEKTNEDVGEGDVGNENESYRKSLLKLKDSFEESSHKLKRLDTTIDELIIKAERNMAWFKEQRAIRQGN